jgi:hypothetical protein
MAWKKGQSGNPKGSTGTEKLVRQALLMELKGSAGLKRLRVIAAKALEQAEGGDATARSWVSDRIDGRVPMPIAGPDGEGPVTVILKQLAPAKA